MCDMWPCTPTDKNAGLCVPTCTHAPTHPSSAPLTTVVGSPWQPGSKPMRRGLVVSDFSKGRKLFPNVNKNNEWLKNTIQATPIIGFVFLKRVDSEIQLKLSLGNKSH